MSSGAATAGFYVDKRFTTLELIGTRDCGEVFGAGAKTASLVCWGGAFINKTACVGELTVSGDAIIEGNLVVLGSRVVESAECLTVENQNICLGNVRGGVPTDVTANAGGILIRSIPGHTKSWLWLNDIGPTGAWNSNQDINIGKGRLTPTSDDFSACPSCGLDTAIRGFAYRIDGESVLTLTELGNTVIYSSLQSVGTLARGAIDSISVIVSTTPGNPTTCIQTAENHELLTGDTVLISGSNTTPSIDGCYAVTVTTPSSFCINAATIGAGTTGSVSGPTFPINIGTSPLWSGTHTINCGNDLIVMNGSGMPTLFMNGTAEQLQLINTASSDYAQFISSSFSGAPLGGTQRALWIQNQSDSTTIPSTTTALDVEQQYSGTSTTFTDNELTLHSIGQRIVMDVSPQIMNPKISSRGIDVTSAAFANSGTNIGVFAEAGGPPGCTAAAGVMGFSNPDSGVFQVGVFGCANMVRQTLANDINEIVVGGGLTVGGFFCNPNTGPNDWALYTEGRVNLAGDTGILGNLHIAGPELIIGGNAVVANDFVVGGNLIVDGCISTSCLALGGNVSFTGNVLFEQCITTQCLTVTGGAHFEGNVLYDLCITTPCLTVTGNAHLNQISAANDANGLTIAGETYYNNDVTTNGLTDSLIASIPVAAEKVAFFETKAVATNAADPTNVKAIDTKQAYYNNGVALVAMGPPTTPDSWASGAGTSGWSIVYSVVGTTMNVYVHGENTKTINWRARIAVVWL